MLKRKVPEIMLIMLLVSLLSISMHAVLVKAEPSFVDIKIVNLTASPTTVCVGETVNVTATYEITWIDVDPEAWAGIRFYYNETWIETLMMMIMGSGYDIRNFTFNWQTGDVEPASYMISATVYGDDDPIGNTFMFGPLQVLPIGDINGDFRVDTQDLILFIKAFGSYPTHPRWNPNADFNNDNQIDIRDLVLLLKHFGEHYP